MLELLAPYGVAYDLLDLGVRRARPQRRAQVGLVHREEARAERPLGGEPDPVAVAAERLGDGGDEADLAAPVGEPVAPRGAVALAAQRLEFVLGLDDRRELGARQDLRHVPVLVGVE